MNFVQVVLTVCCDRIGLRKLRCSAERIKGTIRVDVNKVRESFYAISFLHFVRIIYVALSFSIANEVKLVGLLYMSLFRFRHSSSCASEPFAF